MIAFFKLIRYKNLLMLALMQIVLRFGFLKLQHIPLALNDWQYLLLVFATISIAGGGYVINNILDQETDQINNPDNAIIGKGISEAMAYNIYIALNILGVAAGFYLSYLVGRQMLASIFVIISITLYLYATSFKQSLLIGNIIVALLISLSIIIVGIFDLLPMITTDNRAALATFFELLLEYAFFAFLINFIREIVKDLEDIDGDTEAGMNTLAIVLGVAKTSKLVLALSLIPIAILFYYTNEYYMNNKLFMSVLYFLFFIIAPLIYFVVKMASAKTQKDFSHLSTVLKIVMLMGVLSIVVVNLNIKFNA